MSAALRSLDPSRIEPLRIERVTEQVLARPGFDQARPGAIERLLDTLFDGLRRLFELLGQGAGGSLVGTIALAVLIGGTALIAIMLLRRVRTDRATISRPAGIGGRSAQDWHDLARRAEADGDWGSALRCTYRALLAELIDAGVTDEVAGRTASEYLRDISEAAPATRGPLQFVTNAFEATWYDRRPVDATDVDAVRSAADDVRRAALVSR